MADILTSIHGREYGLDKDGLPVWNLQDGTQVYMTAAEWSAIQRVVSGAWLPPYLGQAAGQCRQPYSISGSTTTSMSRSRHIARNRITQMRVMYPNWYQNGSYVETASGSTQTLKVGLEVNGVNVGLFTWSGSTTVVTASGANSALSDPLACDLQPGDVFFLRPYAQYTGAGRCVFDVLQDATNGESHNQSAGAVPDDTASTGVIASSIANAVLRPLLIVDTITNPSVLLIGDSKVYGVNDPFDGWSGDKGYGRWVGQYFGYLACARGGMGGNHFLASSTRVQELAPYFSHVVSDYGYGDLSTIASDALVTRIQQIAALFPNNAFIPMTLSPATGPTSSDSWATLTNQILSSRSAELALYNDLIRSVPAGFYGCLDVARITEEWGTGKWRVNGAANWSTTDGVHESTTICKLIAAELPVNRRSVV